VGRKPLKQGEFVTELEKQYAELFKTAPESQPVQDEDFQEPHAGRIVPSYTTYSVSERPENA